MWSNIPPFAILLSVNVAISRLLFAISLKESLYLAYKRKRKLKLTEIKRLLNHLHSLQQIYEVLYLEFITGLVNRNQSFKKN